MTSMQARRLSRRKLLQLALQIGGGLAMGAALAPAQRATARSVAAQDPTCFETMQSLLDLCVTAENLMVTLYYTAITQSDSPFAHLPTLAQRELRAALDEEWFHAGLLTNQLGGSSTSNTFFFPGAVLSPGHAGDLLAFMEQLESRAVSLYLAAIRRAGELRQPVLAEVLGQILAIEAEHRAVIREIAQNAPPAPNNLCFEAAGILCAGELWAMLAPYLTGDNGMTGPYALPDQAGVTQAVGIWGGDHSVPPAQEATCGEAVSDILQIAAAAEAIGVTFYLGAVNSPLFQPLPQHQQWYLQAALDEESRHLDFLLANGAAPPPSLLHFPIGVFDALPPFLSLLETLEDAFIAAYLAAIQRLAAAGQPRLAEICGQILGVEAQHRYLSRVMAQQRPANNLCLARSAPACLTDVATALQPFIAGDAGHQLALPLPNAGQINAAVSQFGCVSTNIAVAPVFAYIPQAMR